MGDTTGIRFLGRIQVDEIYDRNGNLINISLLDPLVQQYIHAGAAVQNLDISGLDLQAAAGYKMFISGLNPLGINAELRVFVNADFVDANYSGGFIQESAGAVTGGLSATAILVEVQAGGTWSTEISFQPSGNTRITWFARSRYVIAGANRQRHYSMIYVPATANINSIRLNCVQGNLFDAGTKFVLLRNR